MKNHSFSKFVNDIKFTVSKHSPEILTGLGIAGMITTTVLAVKATPKAMKLIEEEKDRRRGSSPDPSQNLKPVDTIKTTWKCYLPALITGTVSTACLVGASSAHSRRNAVLATAYKLSESALTEYRDKVVETIGEKKEQSIRDMVNKDHIDKNPVSKNEVFLTEKGNTLFYDHSSGRYFKSDIDKMNKSVNELNKRLISETYISLNDLYDEIGLSGTSLGEELGWSADMGLIELHYSAQIAEEGLPCLALDFNISPKYGYDSCL